MLDLFSNESLEEPIPTAPAPAPGPAPASAPPGPAPTPTPAPATDPASASALALPTLQAVRPQLQLQPTPWGAASQRPAHFAVLQRGVCAAVRSGQADRQEQTPRNLVPARLLHVATQLKQIDESDDATAIAYLAKLGLPQMTGQIRDIEQRALQLARDEGREDFRVASLVRNLSGLVSATLLPDDVPADAAGYDANARTGGPPDSGEEASVLRAVSPLAPLQPSCFPIGSERGSFPGVQGSFHTLSATEASLYAPEPPISFPSRRAAAMVSPCASRCTVGAPPCSANLAGAVTSPSGAVNIRIVSNAGSSMRTAPNASRQTFSVKPLVAFGSPKEAAQT